MLKQYKRISLIVIALLMFNMLIAFGEQTQDKLYLSANVYAANETFQYFQYKKLNTLATPRKRKVSKPKVIGSYKTTISDKNKNRVRNIRLAARRINNYTIRPGQIFSFNEVVGKRTPGKGYRTAKIIVQGQSEAGIGGGICQLSTTLYNAAKRSNLQIIERHSHSKIVGYVPKGYDAAVDYGYLDLKFKNTKNYPIKIKARVYKGKVQISLIKAK
jgi:vancomycin resistance protein YoaR